MGGYVVGNDTFPYGYIPPVFIEARLSPDEQAYWNKLRYNVAKVYPYAVTAAHVIQKVDDELLIKNKKKDQKAYIKQTQKMLNDEFKDELKNLTITQGKILVKLINRQTGRNTYSIIKNMRGGLNARFFQTAAFFFDNDLKAQYDPYGEDKDIETIVTLLEDKQIYQYQTKLLERRLKFDNKKK